MTIRRAQQVIGLVGVARLALGVWLSFRPFDDTYITFRYALNLAAGNGFVYNIGESVLGTTSPLWALVLACLRLVHIPLESGSLVVSLTLDVLSALFIFRILHRLEFETPVGLMAALLFLSWFDFLSLARSGMETSTFVFLVLGALNGIVAGRFIVAAIASSLACLTRPEGAVLVAALPLGLWVDRERTPRRDRYASAGIACAILGAWAAFALLTFGSVVPQSVIAKAATAGDQALRHFSWTNLALFFLKGQYGGDIFTRTYLQLMPAASALAAIATARLGTTLVRDRDTRAVRRVLVLLFFPACYIGGLALSHAFTFFPWYYGPVYPFLVSLAIVGVAVVANQRASLIVAAGSALIAAQLVSAYLVKLPNATSFWVEGYSQVSSTIPRDPGVRVAAPEIGMVGWRVWPSRVLDLEGLVTPAAVGVADEDYIRENLPDYLVVRTDNASALLNQLSRQEWFRDHYHVVADAPDPHDNRRFVAFGIRH